MDSQPASVSAKNSARCTENMFCSGPKFLSWAKPHSTGKTRLVLQPVRAGCFPHPSGQMNQPPLRRRLHRAASSPRKQQPPPPFGRRMARMGSPLPKCSHGKKETSPVADARSTGTNGAYGYACCGTVGNTFRRLASGAPRLAGDGAHGNISTPPTTQQTHDRQALMAPMVVLP